MPLVDRRKIVSPPLHIKLGLIKQFVKALCKEGNCFQYIKAAFSSVSEEKIKEMIFDGPQIRKLIKDPNFISSMNDVDANAWKAFVNVVINFLGNRKQDDYITLVENLLILYNYRLMGKLRSFQPPLWIDSMEGDEGGVRDTSPTCYRLIRLNRLHSFDWEKVFKHRGLTRTG